MRPCFESLTQLFSTRCGGRHASSHALPVVVSAAQALGALAVGALAVGAVAFGVVAVGRLIVGRAQIRRVEIDELVVRKLRITEDLEIPPRRLEETE